MSKSALQLARFQPQSMVVLHDEILVADAASINATGISAAYNHLWIVIQARSTKSAQSDGLNMRFNGDTGANYEFQDIYAAGNGSAAKALSTSQTTAISLVIPAASATTGMAGMYSMEVANYAGTSFWKNTVATSSGPGGSDGHFTEITSSLWMSTAAISSLSIFANGGNLKAGSRGTVYGVGGAPIPPVGYDPGDVLSLYIYTK